MGRARVKRYACLFSCFRTRAIHIEKLDDLSTDALLNGLVRFVSRCGKIKHVYSDNDTNWVGAQNEHASHHGGLWEHMIRTVRRVLMVVMNPDTRLTDEILSTVLCEAECIVNSRPLTKCSDDVTDNDPLTPNHFLIMGGNFSLPWANVPDNSMLQRRWRHAQVIANHFWKRWLREYLPELNRRQKW